VGPRAAGLPDPEEYSVAGLLHDLGKVVAAVQMPELHESVSQAVREQDLRWFEAERAVMGFGPDRINARLARHWNLPGNIREGMSHHHSPETAQLYPDTAAALRGMELKVEAILKATKVDGVYDKDPRKFDDAVRYECVTYLETLEKRLGVMDSTAISLARDNCMPIIVFNLFKEGNIRRVVSGEPVGTIVQGGN
jgi:hypothetical protein